MYIPNHQVYSDPRYIEHNCKGLLANGLGDKGYRNLHGYQRGMRFDRVSVGFSCLSYHIF